MSFKALQIKGVRKLTMKIAKNTEAKTTTKEAERKLKMAMMICTKARL